MSSPQSVRQLIGPERLAALDARRDLPGLVFLSAHAALLAATGTLVWLALGTLWLVPAMIVHGIVIVYLFAPFHEASHGTAFRTRWLNDAVAWITGIALGLFPRHFRFEHAAHHAWTQTPGRDPQMIANADTVAGYLRYATAVPYFVNLFRHLATLPFGRFTEEERRFIPERALRSVQRGGWPHLAIYGALLVGSIALGTWAVAIYWFVPRLLGEPFMRLVRMSEHVGRPLVRDLLRNTRTVRTVTPLRWLSWNMSLHAEHHAVPSVPFFALPALHGIIGDRIEDVQPGYIAAQAVLIRNATANGAGA
jgi:fatty acid desaturase